MAQKTMSTFFKRKREETKDSIESSVESSEESSVESSHNEVVQVSKVIKVSEEVKVCNRDNPDPLERANIDFSWAECLADAIKKPYYQSLEKFVENERKGKTIYPSREEVFSWTRYCKLENVKVIILGQDPYHGPNQAHGLCFSVKIGIAPPPSLKNIYKALSRDIEGFSAPDHGYLVGWAQQGVLMLNAVLTVEHSKANAHKGRGWEKLTDHVIKHISRNLKNCVFMLWGGPAIKKHSMISKDHLVLTAVHPSPLSAHRGFLDCAHFSKANAYLQEHGKQQIDWCELPSTQ